MLKIIELLDAGCGIGKTTAIINYINSSNNNDKFLYITPFLSEVERIIDKCKKKNFKQPTNKKTEDIASLLKKGYNIAATHALFEKISEDIDKIPLKNYILIIDERIDTLKPIPLCKDDISMLLNTKVIIKKDDNSLVWNEDYNNYKGHFSYIKAAIDLGGCILSKDNTMIAQIFPNKKILSLFKDIFLLTFMFEAQSYYYDLINIPIEKLFVKNFQITKEEQHYDYSKQKSLITILEDEKLNSIGKPEYSLSKTWFENASPEDLDTLRKHIQNFFRNKTKSKSNQRLWTTFKDYKDLLSAKGYITAFAPLNTRGTNRFYRCNAVAYIANIYLNPYIKNFAQASGIQINEDAHALSEMLQFIYRSAIRDNKHITLYIPSKRMREILKDWLNN